MFIENIARIHRKSHWIPSVFMHRQNLAVALDLFLHSKATSQCILQALQVGKKQNFGNPRKGSKDLTFKMVFYICLTFFFREYGIYVCLQGFLSSSHILLCREWQQNGRRMAVLGIGRKKVQSSLCDDFSGFALTVVVAK